MAQGCGNKIDDARADAQYCSDLCRNRAWRLRQRKAELKDRSYFTEVCDHCAKPRKDAYVVDGRIILRNANRLYCSNRCRLEHHAKLAKNRKLGIAMPPPAPRSPIRSNSLRTAPPPAALSVVSPQKLLAAKRLLGL